MLSMSAAFSRQCSQLGEKAAMVNGKWHINCKLDLDFCLFYYALIFNAERIFNFSCRLNVWFAGPLIPRHKD